MIIRITKIKGVGRFQDCPSLGGRHFSKNTIIFGQNAGGKSTLTDILWSYKTGNGSIIEGRKTFGYTNQPEIEFIDDKGSTFKYPSAEWLKGSDYIEIFDTQFINENIFEGHEITYGHQKNLHTIIIGPKGNKLSAEINSIQEQFSELTNKKSSKTNEFNRIFKKEITAEEFSKLPKIENPESKIKEKKDLIEVYNNQAKIKAAFSTVELQLESVVQQATKSILSSTIKVNADKIIDHIQKTWKNPEYSKDFLQLGVNLTKDQNKFCVFCGQELSEEAKKLLQEYEKFFSNEYRSLQVKVSDAITKFLKWNPQSFLESIQDKLASVKINLELDKAKISDLLLLKESVDREFELKMKDLGYELDFQNFDSIIEFFRQIQKQIEEIKKGYVFEKSMNTDAINKEIKNIEYSKMRHSPEWEDFFKEYEEIEKVQDGLKSKREKLRSELNTYSDQLFKIHFDTINRILQELGADFILCDFQPMKKLVGQSERIFALKFFKSHRVLIDEKSVNKPNFKNTLSESDKRVLAFSFFYSLMIHDPKLNEKIIVFDDPFSSFDSDRRTKTTELLANPHLIDENGEIIEKEINQLIILTHESEFFKWVFRRLDTPKALRIVSNGDYNGVSKSTIIDCDVYKEFIENENIKNLKEIEEVCSANKPIVNYDGICVKCRKIMESIFKRKYLFELENEIYQSKSIRTFVEKLKDKKVNHYDDSVKYKNFIFLCDNLNIELHDSSMKNEGKNAQIILTDFLKLIKEI
ncbi:MAG: AAA family ATPase [Ignavibacteria bacterium]|nr:AAA family ATPase [Ignavibacteria bacterium]